MTLTITLVVVKVAAAPEDPAHVQMPLEQHASRVLLRALN
jgi:hypothetical protein